MVQYKTIDGKTTRTPGSPIGAEQAALQPAYWNLAPAGTADIVSSSGRTWVNALSNASVNTGVVDTAEVPTVEGASNPMSEVGLLEDERVLFDTEVWGNGATQLTLTFTGVDQGSYVFTYYAHESFYTTPNQRIINEVTVNGIQVLSNVDLHAAGQAQSGTDHAALRYMTPFEVGVDELVTVVCDTGPPNGVENPMYNAISWEPQFQAPPTPENFSIDPQTNTIVNVLVDQV